LVNVYLRFMELAQAKVMLKPIVLSILLVSQLVGPVVSPAGPRQIPLVGQSSTWQLPPVGQPAAWQLPLMGQATLVRPYLQPSSDYSAGHRGVDYQVAAGSTLVSPADGVVSFAGNLVNRSLIAIKHEGGFVSEIEPACPIVGLGEVVKSGQAIAQVCSAGSTYQQHCQKVTCIHFSLRLNGLYLSPLAVIGGLNPTRLFPYARG
jgi:murein DD-endopeptidase MepM/ murein hydrolase activator NlpD